MLAISGNYRQLTPRYIEDFLGKEKAGGSSPPVGSKFNKTISLHLLDDFLSQKCGKEMLFRRALYPNLVWQGHSEWHHIHRSGGDRSRRSVGPQWRPAGGRTGPDRGADIKGRTNQRFFSKVSYTTPGTLLAGYRLGALAPVSRDESAVRAIQRPGVRP